MKDKNQSDKIKKNAPDPIIDGDARPDMPLTPGNENAKNTKKNKTTVNRADSDTREDFKDAKYD